MASLVHMEPEKLSLDDLETVCEELCSVERKWYNIGLQLQVPLADLQIIESECKDDQRICLRRMIQKWLEAGNATWVTLCEVLKIVGDDMKLVDKLLEKYCGKTEGDDSSDQSSEDYHESSGLSVLKKVCIIILYLLP